MLEDAIKLLETIGVPVTFDDPLLTFILSSITEQIKNATNQANVPEGLHHVAVEMAVGQYLKWMKDSGKLEGFDLEAAVKSIQEGDTNITYAIGDGSLTPEQRLDNLINYMMSGHSNEFKRYRRLVW